MVVFQVFMLFVLFLAIHQTVSQLIGLFKGVTVDKLKDLLFSICTLAFSLVIIGVIQIKITGIL